MTGNDLLENGGKKEKNS